MDSLFASPLVTLQVNDATRLNAVLRREIHQMRAASNGVLRSNQKGWHSDPDLFGRTEPGCRRLQAAMLDAVRQATLQIAADFDFSGFALQAEGWVNLSGRNAFSAPHDHPGWAWSGCYYVTVPPLVAGRSGAIEFFDPRTNVRAMSIDGADCFASKVTLLPREGMLLLFPSYLRHWVYPNDSDDERISIAFNVRFLKRPSARSASEARVETGAAASVS